MKKDSTRIFRIFKACQLTLLIVFFITFYFYLKTDPVLSNNIFTNSKLLTICVFLWAFMVFSFISILVDFKQLDKSLVYEDDLNRIAYRDTLTGIPNRVSCDLIFQQYEGRSDVTGLSAALISITNLAIINEALGRVKGDFLIHDFATIFENVGNKFGFVGRNGGNEFLIIIEHSDAQKMKDFLDALASAVKDYNDTSEHMPVSYKVTSVVASDLEEPTFSNLITQLYSNRS